MSNHNMLIEKYQKNGKTVSIGLPALGLFKAMILEFDPAGDQVIIQSRDELYANLKFSCHSSQVLFIVKP